MDKNNSLYKDELLIKIANHLIINASFITDLGIYHGKMGIVIFFAHYARYKSNPIYNDFAAELLNDIYDDISANTPFFFEYGLCGIGCGIEYLYQNNFVEVVSEEVMEIIDKKIMEKDLLRITDKSFKTGLTGISFYVESRLKNKSKNRKMHAFDESYLKKIKKFESKVVSSTPKDLLSEILKDLPDNDDVHSMPLGLNKGCSGIGLKMIL